MLIYAGTRIVNAKNNKYKIYKNTKRNETSKSKWIRNTQIDRRTDGQTDMLTKLLQRQIKTKQNKQTNKNDHSVENNSSAIAERSSCRVGQFWPKVEDDILQTS